MSKITHTPIKTEDEVIEEMLLDWFRVTNPAHRGFKEIPLAGWYYLSKRRAEPKFFESDYSHHLVCAFMDIANQKSQESPPESSYHVCGEGGDSCDIIVFEDGSCVDWNNADTVVWYDVRDYAESIRDVAKKLDDDDDDDDDECELRKFFEEQAPGYLK